MQCNWCSYVCPHGVVRPFVLTKEEAEGVEDTTPMKGDKKYDFTLGWSLMDCTGCGSCSEVCPARNKAITMAPAEDEFMHAQQAKFDHLYKDIDEKLLPLLPENNMSSPCTMEVLDHANIKKGYINSYCFLLIDISNGVTK